MDIDFKIPNGDGGFRHKYVGTDHVPKEGERVTIDDGEGDYPNTYRVYEREYEVRYSTIAKSDILKVEIVLRETKR